MFQTFLRISQTGYQHSTQKTEDRSVDQEYLLFSKQKSAQISLSTYWCILSDIGRYQRQQQDHGCSSPTKKKPNNHKVKLWLEFYSCMPFLKSMFSFVFQHSKCVPTKVNNTASLDCLICQLLWWPILARHKFLSLASVSI